jgi:hypothetical protein
MSNNQELEELLEDTIEDQLDRVLDYTRRKNVQKIREEHAEDPLFSRFHLDTQEFVLAKLGNGLQTSIHRKIGDLIETNIQQIIRHKLGIDSPITYDATIVVDGEEKARELDALIRPDELSGEDKERVEEFIATHGDSFNVNQTLSSFDDSEELPYEAIGFEIRHCYQSADSKRAQADIAMANHLINEDIMPVMLILCSDSNQDVIGRYKNYMHVYEGENSFQLIQTLSGFDYAQFLDDREPMIDNKMETIFKMF